MEKKELDEILALHLKWLKADPGGKRANLVCANLRGANLRGANLRGADLGGADLRGAKPIETRRYIRCGKTGQRLRLSGENSASVKSG